MEITPNKLLSKPLVIAAGSEIDMLSLSDVTSLVNTVLAAWPKDTVTILQQRNKGLFEMLMHAESRVVSMLYIANKPKNIQKEFKAALKEYERIGTLCGVYAKRHCVGN